jgi:hypothetical protein
MLAALLADTHSSPRLRVDDTTRTLRKTSFNVPTNVVVLDHLALHHNLRTREGGRWHTPSAYGLTAWDKGGLEANRVCFLSVSVQGLDTYVKGVLAF